MSDVIGTPSDRERPFGDRAPEPVDRAVGDLVARWRSSAPILLAGGVWIIAGGLAAAVTGPSGWEHGSWIAAFLVLVAGVAQIGVGSCQAQLAPVPPTVRFAAVECAAWNAACISVVVGTLLAFPIIVSIGGASLVAALVMSALAVRGSGSRHPSFLRLYRALVVVLLVSVPIGIALSWTRH